MPKPAMAQVFCQATFPAFLWRGHRLVVWAIAEGRKAAKAVDGYLAES